MFDTGDTFEKAVDGTMLPNASSLLSLTMGSVKWRGGIPFRTEPKVRRILCRRVGGGGDVSAGRESLSYVSTSSRASTAPPERRVGGRP